MSGYKHIEVKKGDLIKSSEWNKLGNGLDDIYNSPVTLEGDLTIKGSLNTSQIVFNDKQNEMYGSIRGNIANKEFGLTDSNGDWSYLSVKGSHTEHRIGNNVVMKIESNGEISIQSNGQSINLQEYLVPVGTVNAYAGDKVKMPDGWLECNGDPISRTIYAKLFNQIGTIYGSGNGSTTFNLPDYRGYFLRGWDHGAKNDPEALLRTDRGDGVTGDNVGSKQDDQFEQHNHSTVQMIGNNNIDGVDSTTTHSGDHHNEPRLTGNKGGKETRPKNINVLYIIKY